MEEWAGSTGPGILPPSDFPMDFNVLTAIRGSAQP
jgi:hypothetical protein